MPLNHDRHRRSSRTGPSPRLDTYAVQCTLARNRDEIVNFGGFVYRLGTALCICRADAAAPLQLAVQVPASGVTFGTGQEMCYSATALTGDRDPP